MSTAAHATYSPSTYAQVLLDRGHDIAAGEMARLEEIVAHARAIMRADDPARPPLDRVSDAATCGCDESMARRIDRLSGAIVEAQRLVSHETRASAILFLDVAKRDRWPSYGDYRRDWDTYLARCLSRH